MSSRLALAAAVAAALAAATPAAAVKGIPPKPVMVLNPCGTTSPSTVCDILCVDLRKHGYDIYVCSVQDVLGQLP